MVSVVAKCLINNLMCVSFLNIPNLFRAKPETHQVKTEARVHTIAVCI